MNDCEYTEVSGVKVQPCNDENGILGEGDKIVNEEESVRPPRD